MFWETLIPIHLPAKVVAIWQLQKYNQLCDLISLTLSRKSYFFWGVKSWIEAMRKTVLSDFLENFTYNYYLESDQNRTGCIVAPQQELVRTGCVMCDNVTHYTLHSDIHSVFSPQKTPL